MAFTTFRGMKPFPQLMFSLFVIVVSFLAFMVLSLVVAIPLFGIDSILNVPSVNDLNDPHNILILKYFQVVQSFGLFIIPPIILGWLFQGNFLKYLYLNKNIQFSSVLIVLVLIVAVTPFINFIGEFNANMQLPEWMGAIERWMKINEENASKLTEAFLNVETLSGLIFNLFMVAFLAAFGEEFLFRGLIQRIFSRITKSHHWGIWISAILFSALHMQFYGFIPRMLLGVMFGYLLIWSGSMWIPVLAHFINNAIGVLGLYYINQNKLNPKIEEIGSTSESYYLAAISVVLIFVLMYTFKKQNQSNQLQLNSLET
jgi:hypothetical protein